MLTHDATLAALGDRTTLVKVTIGGTDFSDLYDRDWIRGVTISENVDNALSECAIQLAREEDLISLSPLDGTSIANAVADVLALNALVIVQTSEAPNATSADEQDNWHEVFRGRVDAIDWAANPLTVRCRNIACELQNSVPPVARAYAIGRTFQGIQCWRPGLQGVEGEYVAPSRIDAVDPAGGGTPTKVYVCDTTGITGDTEPKWPDDTGTTVVDGTAEWHRYVATVSSWSATAAITFGAVRELSGGEQLICCVAGTTGSSEPTVPAGSPAGYTVDDGTVRWAVYPTQNGGMPIEGVMQSILGSAYPPLYTPVSPAWIQTPFIYPAGQPKLDFLRQLALQIGWDLRLRYVADADDHATWGRWRLTFYEPDRATTTALSTFDDDQYGEPRRCEQSAEDIRNWVEIGYYDWQDVWSDDSPKRKYHEARDETSVTAYGARFMGVGSGWTSNINSATEAEALADAILSDLAEPGLIWEVPIPYQWWVEIGDLYQFNASTWFSSAQKLAVVGYSHDLGAGTTTLQTRGKATAGVYRWLDVAAGPGRGPPPRSFGAQGVTGAVTATATPGGALIQWDPPSVATPPGVGYANANTGGGARQYEIHASTDSGFTPDDSTLVGISDTTVLAVTNLTPGTTYYVKIYAVDALGERSAESAQIKVVPDYADESLIHPALMLACAASLSADQTGTARDGEVVLDVEDYDSTMGLWDADADELEAPDDGLYFVSAQAEVTQLSTGEVARLVLKVNGTAAVTGPAAVATTDKPCGISVQANLDLAREDVVTVHLSCSGSGTVTVESGARLDAHRVLAS